MKFLCDRCKTRYSIADERVRGKILKIRCKNCSNVITVREGMPEPEPEAPAVADARRVTRPTDYAPAITGTSPLQSAFAKEMTSGGAKPSAPPPSQLEEEWFVSLDGDQQGPFSLPEAQAWVGAKKTDDDLFCWCEGFDEWLPVEKVSHFRGLRGGGKRARTTGQVAVLARPGPPPPPTAAPKPPEEEPKPLFAAALAALEADAAADAAKPAIPAPVPASVSAPTPLAPPLPAAARTPAPKATLPTPTPTPLRATPAIGSPPIRPAARPAQAAAMFDHSEEPSDVHAMPVPPMVAPALDDDEPSEADGYDGDDGEFAIGEVSRVVRLADIAAKRPPAAAATPVRTTARTTLGRGTAAAAAVPGTTPMVSSLAIAASASLDDHHGAAPGDGAVLAPIARPARRAHLPLILLGVLLLAGVIAVVVLVTSGDDDEGSRRAGGGADIEDLALRNDDPRYSGTGAASGTGSAVASGTSKGTSRGTGGVKPRGTGTGTAIGTGTATTPGTGTSQFSGLEDLSPDDVVNVANRMSSGTQRCYGLAQKKDPFLKVKSIGVLINVEPAGNVSSVKLDSQGGTILGTCLESSIGRWKFRKSPDGIDTKITLKFEQVVGP